jgi:hypothetical protein
VAVRDVGLLLEVEVELVAMSVNDVSSGGASGKLSRT